MDNSSYPPLPGAGTTPPPPAKPGAPAGSKPASAAKAAPPRTLGGSIADLTGAAFRNPANGGVPPRPAPPGGTTDEGDHRAPVASARPAAVPATGLDALRRATRPATASRPEPPAPPLSVGAAPDGPVGSGSARGQSGGLARWDDLRGRLRRVLDPDDPLFEMVNTLEASELAVQDQLRVFREENARLLNRLDEGSEASGEARDHAEQAARASTDVRDVLESVLPLLQEIHELALRPVPAPAAVPSSPTLSPDPAPPGWWFRLGRFLGVA